MCQVCDFVHLHNHTVYSKLDGAISANLLFDRLKELNMDSFAKTDHGTLAGTMEFMTAATKAGVKLICGCEFYEVNDIREKFIGDGADCRTPDKVKREDAPDERPDQKKQKYWHVTMLAKDKVGYDQLVRLSSAANTQDAYFFKPRIDGKMIAEIVGDNKGHIKLGTGCAISRMSKTALSNDAIGALDKDLDYYHKLFGADDIYVEIMATGYDAQKEINVKLIELAEKRGLPIVVTNDCHYLTEEHARLQDILVCISTNQYVDGERNFKFEGSNYFVKTPDQLRKIFKETQGIDVKQEWFDNSRLIANSCEHCGYAKDPEFKLPQYTVQRDRLFGEFKDWVEGNAELLAERFGATPAEIGKLLEISE